MAPRRAPRRGRPRLSRAHPRAGAHSRGPIAPARAPGSPRARHRRRGPPRRTARGASRRARRGPPPRTPFAPRARPHPAALSSTGRGAVCRTAGAAAAVVGGGAGSSAGTSGAAATVATGEVGTDRAATTGLGCAAGSAAGQPSVSPARQVAYKRREAVVRTGPPRSRADPVGGRASQPARSRTAYAQ